MSEDKVFEALAAEVEPDLGPSGRLRPAWQRALTLLPYALFAVAGLVLVLGVRKDAAALGPWWLWGVGALQLAVSFAVFRFMLNESLPGQTSRPRSWLAATALVLAAQISAARFTYDRSPVPLGGDERLPFGTACMGLMTVIGVPVLLLGMFLASRGLPARPRVTGLIAGVAGGLAAEAVYRAHCPYSDAMHIVVWHSGAVVFLGALGFFAGAVWSMRDRERWRNRRTR